MLLGISPETDFDNKFRVVRLQSREIEDVAREIRVGDDEGDDLLHVSEDDEETRGGDGDGRDGEVNEKGEVES